MVELLRKIIEDWKGKLKDVSLMNANLHEAYLSTADLRGAILQETNLKDAELEGTDLTGTINGINRKRISSTFKRKPL